MILDTNRIDTCFYQVATPVGKRQVRIHRLNLGGSGQWTLGGFVRA